MADSILLTDDQIDQLDPYQLMAAIGKQVIHPGGRRSTAELIGLGRFDPSHRVLDVGCGVGTTAVLLAKRFGCKITAVDVDPRMIRQARARVLGAQVRDHVRVDVADIQNLPFDSGTFDRVVVEAVTMFVNRQRAAAEIVRVCRPGGLVLDHEFIYRRLPTPDIRRIFEGEVCPGIRFDSAEDWCTLFREAGLTDLRYVSGPFSMMSFSGMLRDEGIRNLIRMFVTASRRRAYRQKLSWLMPRMLRVRSYLGYVVLAGNRPPTA